LKGGEGPPGGALPAVGGGGRKGAPRDKRNRDWTALPGVRDESRAIENRKATLKNPLELVKEKEAQITQLKLEISALRVALPLLLEEEDGNAHKERPESDKQAC
jgi:hypothetical protein